MRTGFAPAMASCPIRGDRIGDAAGFRMLKLAILGSGSMVGGALKEEERGESVWAESLGDSSLAVVHILEQPLLPHTRSSFWLAVQLFTGCYHANNSRQLP